jgi:cysteine-rich repeat protein
VADCVVEVPACRTAVTCEQGKCAFEDALEGTLVPDQKAGDCAETICDGLGKTRIVAVEADREDDGNPCTEDVCIGLASAHMPLLQVACYSGASGTEGVGACKAGVQKCDAQGMPTGGCVAEVVPAEETCESPLDDDCDGLANEEGPGCACEPGTIKDCYTGPADTLELGTEAICHAGYQMCNADGLGFGTCLGEQTPLAETCDAAGADEDCDGAVNEEGADCACGDGFLSAGEECDDGNADPTDGCTTACKKPACGDGFWQQGTVPPEECDDGNQDDTDLCLTTCVSAKCGDALVQPALGESCDDGNFDDTDACPNTCQHRVLEVFGGASHTCAKLSGDILKCWGGNSLGQLGLGDVLPRGYEAAHMGGNLPAVDLGEDSFGQPNRVVTIAAATSHTCALLTDGLVKCWGNNNVGQLGLSSLGPYGDGPGEMGNSLLAVKLGTGETAQAIAAGELYTCALVSDGNVKCWGYNVYGQLGLGDTKSRGLIPTDMGDNLPAVDLGTDANLGTTNKAKAITAGAYHACALLEGGDVKCWGYNAYGQLGLGDKIYRGDGAVEMGNNLPAVDLGTGVKAKAIAAGHHHNCALLEDGNVKCWGYNAYGQLGLGDASPRGDGPGEMGDNLPAVNLGTGKTALSISVGFYHSCALLDDGRFKCWGYNAYGQLGLGDANPRGDGGGEMGNALLPIDVGMANMNLTIQAGGFQTCAILQDGRLKCWGYNNFGQLGLGDQDNRGDQPNEMGDNLPIVKLVSDLF